MELSNGMMLDDDFEVPASYEDLAASGKWYAVRSSDNLEIITYEYHALSQATLAPVVYFFKRSPDARSCSLVQTKRTDFLNASSPKSRWIYKDLVTAFDDDWFALDQPWNRQLQASFEGYIEIRFATLEELKTRLAAEIDCSLGRRSDNPFWWKTWAADNNFMYSGNTQASAAVGSATGQTSPLEGGQKGALTRSSHSGSMLEQPPTPSLVFFDRSGEASMAFMTNADPAVHQGGLDVTPILAAKQTSPTRLTKEMLELHDMQLRGKKASVESASARPLAPAGQPLKHFGSDSRQPLSATLQFRRRHSAGGLSLNDARSQLSTVSVTSTIRRKLISTVRHREQLPLEFQFAAEVASTTPAALMTWDDTPENNDMEWEKRLVFDESGDIDWSETDAKNPDISGLHLKAETEDVIFKTVWNSRSEYAPGFARKETRAHAVEDIEYDEGSDMPRVVEYFWDYGDIDLRHLEPLPEDTLDRLASIAEGPEDDDTGLNRSLNIQLSASTPRIEYPDEPRRRSSDPSPPKSSKAASLLGLSKKSPTGRKSP